MKEILLIAILGYLFYGCKGETIPVGIGSTGNITGTVKILNSPSDDNSGVRIYLSDTYLSAVSHSDGKWEIFGIPQGVYTLVFSKAGYFTQEYFNFQILDSVTQHFSGKPITQIPSITMKQLSINIIDSTKSIFFQGILSNRVRTDQQIYILLSKSVSTNSLPVVAFQVLGFTVKNSLSEFNFECPFNLTNIANVNVGDTLYAIGYAGDNLATGINYNSITNLYEFNTAGATLSNVVRFVIP